MIVVKGSMVVMNRESDPVMHHACYFPGGIERSLFCAACMARALRAKIAQSGEGAIGGSWSW